MIFVDTNFFLRFLLQDVTSQHQEAKKLFEEAILGKVKLITSALVFFEIYWVLSSFYEKNKPQISKILEDLLKMDFIKYENKKLLGQATTLFSQTNLDLEDAYNLSFAKKSKVERLATFDKKLARRFGG